MSRPITSPQQLASIVERLRSLPTVTAKVAARVAPRLSELAAEAYDARRSVYGEPWGTGESGDPIDLYESGTLKGRALGYLAAGRTVRASVSTVKYARYQIKRGILPRGGAKLPPAWEAEIRRIAGEELAAHVEGGAA